MSSSRPSTSRRWASPAASACRSISRRPRPPTRPARSTRTGSTARGTRRRCSTRIGRPTRGRPSTTRSARRHGRRATRGSRRPATTGTTCRSSTGSSSTSRVGSARPFGKLCYYVVVSEYGGPPEQQSALNLVYILSYDDSRNGQQFQSSTTPSLYGTDEKWHIHGGNDQLVSGMVGQLPSGTIRTGHRLVARQGQRQPDLHPDVPGRGVDGPGRRRPRGAGPAVLDPPPGRPDAHQPLAAQAAGDRRAPAGHQREGHAAGRRAGPGTPEAIPATP